MLRYTNNAISTAERITRLIDLAKKPAGGPAPAGAFSLYIRAYWGKQGILDGSWKPPAIKRVN